MTNNDWINIEDELPPKNHEDYLVYPPPDSHYNDGLTAEHYKGEWIVHCEDSHGSWSRPLENVTHWQQLPKPPTE